MQDRLNPGILWMAAVAVGIFMVVMVVSTVRADARSPAPAMTSCRDLLLTSARSGYNGGPGQVIGPAERAARLARTTAATVRGTSRNSRFDGGSYLYSESDGDAIIVFDSSGRAVAVLSLDGDMSISRLRPLVECEP